MFCMKCGTEIKNGVCPNCGTVDKDAASAVQPQPPKQSPQQTAQQPPQQPAQQTMQQQRYYGAPPVYQNPSQAPYGYEAQNIGSEPPKQSRYKQKAPWNKKKKRTLAIIISSVAFLLVVGGLLTGYLLIDKKYSEAVDDLSRERPKTALKSFEEIKWFKESDEYIIKCNNLITYNDAVDMYDDEEYEDALPVFKQLGDYEESEDYAQLCQNYIDYTEADSLFETQDYEAAQTIFVSLGEFEDSKNMAQLFQNNIDYLQAKMYFEDEDYEAANELFEKIPEFEDSSDMIFYCDCLIRYNEALGDIDKESFSKATQALEKIKNDILGASLDFTDILEMEELNYNLGQSYFGDELYYSAYNAFRAAGGYEDSAAMSDKCIQTVKTEEIYINPDYTKNTVKMTYYGVEDSSLSIYVEVYQDGTLVSTCFIKYDEKLVVKYPTGKYTFKIYEGDKWFGPEEKFGSSTASDSIVETFKSNYYYWIEF